MEATDIISRLQRAAQKHLNDVTVTGASPLTAGASADTWIVDVELGPESDNPLQRWILRRDAGDENISTAISKAAEAKTQIACARYDVPVANIIFILDEDDGLGAGYVMSCLEGETLPQKILKAPELEQARQSMTEQCGKILAQIHNIPTSDLPELPNESTEQKIEELYQLYLGFGEKLPVFELAFRWLKQHIPASKKHSLVHGDFRNGNVMVDSSGIVGVLDWELSHLGDPMEDLGWLCVNSWRFGRRDKAVGGFGERQELYRAYHQYSGIEVDENSVRFWEIYGTLRWGIICQYQAFAHISGNIRSIERAMIGRRVSETAIDILSLLYGDEDWPAFVHSFEQSDEADKPIGSAIYDRPYDGEILEALQEFMQDQLLPQTEGKLQFNIRVALNAVKTLQRQQKYSQATAQLLIQQLQGLLQSSDTDFRSLMEQLCQAIRDNHIEWDSSQLQSYLCLMCLHQLAVDNPRYSTFKALTEGQT